LPVSKPVSPSPAPISVPPPEKAQPHPEKLVAQPLASPEKPQTAKLEPVRLTSAMPVSAADAAPKAPATAAAPAISLPPPTVSLPAPAPTASAPAPATGVAPVSNLISTKVVAPPKPESASQPGLHTEDSTAENADATRELYFEVGKFKNVLQAHDETDKLAQLGFPATAVEKGHLWTNSFHVLVGPYPDEDQAKSTHENLVTSGFKPRPFEKGWRNLTLLSSVTLNGARAPEGEYTVSWESYVIGDASVKLMRNSSVVAAAGGRWVKRDVKYSRDAYVYRKNPDGSRTLLEIHFGGMREALVFGKPS
jgi:cell division protein FtsN